MKKLINFTLALGLLLVIFGLACVRSKINADSLDGYFYAPVAYFNNETADTITDYIVSNGRLVDTYDSSSFVNYTFCYDMNIVGKLFTNDEDQGDNYVDFRRCRFYTDYQVFKSTGYRFTGSIDVHFELFSEQVEGDWFSVCYYDSSDVFPNGELGQSFIYTVYFSDDVVNGYVYLETLRTETSPFTYLYKMLSIDIFNFAFDKGYNSAVNANASTIYQDGIKEGYQQAISEVVQNPNIFNLYSEDDIFKYGQSSYDDGYYVGYHNGINESNVYTFDKLIFSIIDTPVKILFGTSDGGGLLNFDLLGYNMSGFALSLITISIIIKIVMVIL